ncbi:MAG: PilZ domain-containing protein [Planctomycetota bacterium]
MSTSRWSEEVTATPRREHVVERPTFKQVSVDMLKPGVVLKYPVFDEKHTKLLGAKTEISNSFADRLKQRHVHSVVVEQTDIVRLNDFQPPSSTHHNQQRRVARCTWCGQALPLNLPSSGEPSVTWACTKCDAKYQTSVNPERYSELNDTIRPLNVDVQHAQVQRPPDEIARFVNRLIEPSYQGSEKRSRERYPICIPVVALPLDEKFRPVGDPVVSMSRNLSTDGIALIHNRALKPKYLILELSSNDGTPIQMVLEVLRCRSVGRFFEIAGRFLMRMDN